MHAVDTLGAWRIPRMLPSSLVAGGRACGGAGTWQVLPSAMYRGTGLLTTRGGGFSAATAALLAAVASRARGGCVERVAHSMDASIVPRRERGSA